MLPGTLLAGLLPLFAGLCLLEFSCDSFYFVSFQFTHKNRSWIGLPPRNRRNNYNNYNNHKHNNNSRNCIQPLLWHHERALWKVKKRFRMDLTAGKYTSLWRSQFQGGMAWGWGAQWFWMESADSLLVSVHWTWRHLNYICFCFKDFSRGTSWWFFMTILMITQTPRTTILVYQISHFTRPNY